MPVTDPADRRSALIQAALDSLAARGLGAVSVRDVARRAGVSQGLIRHHFGSFSALLHAAYRLATARVEEALDAALTGVADPAQRMDSFLRASFAPAIADHDLLAAWLAFWGLVRADPAAAAIHAESYAAYRTRIEGLLGDLAPGRDCRLGAIAMTAMLDGLWLELCLDPATFTAEEAIAAAGAWVRGYLASLELQEFRSSSRK